MFVIPAQFFKVENLKYHLHFISFIRNRHNLKSIMQIKFMSHWTSFFEKQGMAKQVLIDYSCGNNAVKNTFHRQKLKVHTNTCLCLLLPRITRMYNSKSDVLKHQVYVCNLNFRCQQHYSEFPVGNACTNLQTENKTCDKDDLSKVIIIDEI